MKKIFMSFMIFTIFLSFISFADKIERTETTDLICSDATGICTKTVYSGSMNYLLNGNYVPINTSNITNSTNITYSKMMNTAPYSVYFKNDSDTSRSVLFKKDNYTFEFDIAVSQAQWFNSNNGAVMGNALNPQHNNISVKNNMITFPNAWNGVNLTYTLFNTEMKESLNISSVPNNVSYADYFRYRINVWYTNSLQVCVNNICYLHPSNVKVNTTRRVDFKDANNTTIFYLPEPYLEDALGNKTNATYFFSLNNGVDLWYIGIPAIFAKTATYPLMLDPTITLQTADSENLEDTTVRNYAPDTNYGSDSLLVTGYQPNYAFIKFANTFQNSVIISSELLLYGSCSEISPQYVSVHGVSNQTWTEDTITFNDKPSNDSSINTSIITSFEHTDYYFNVTSWVSDQNASENISFMLSNNDTMDYVNFVSKEYLYDTQRPKLSVTYVYNVTHWYTNQTTLPTVYNNSFLSNFNITWEGDTVDKVLIESNFTGIPANVSMTRISGNSYIGVYNYNLTLGAGSYYWKSYANDTDNDWNTSTTWNFTIGKATTILSLSGGNSTYPTNISVLASESNSGDTGSIYRLWRNTTNTQNGSSLTDFTKYGANIYLFNYSTDGNANYSGSYSTLIIKITQGTPTPSAEVNGSTSDVGYPRYAILNLTGSSNVDYNLNHTLSLNMTGYGDNYTWNSGASVTNITNFTAIGKFLLNITIWGDANWSTASDTLYITISGTAGSPSYSNLKTSQNSPVEYNPTITYQFNITWNDADGMSKSFLEFNNINYTASNSGSEYYYTFSAKSLNVNNYTYRWFANDSTNAWTVTNSYQYNQTKNSTNPFVLNMTIGPTFYYNTNVSATSADEIKISATMNYTDSGTHKIYIDGVQFYDGYSNTFGVGTHTIIVNTSGNANYSISSNSYYIIVSLPSGGPPGPPGPPEVEYITGNWSLQKTDAFFTMSPGSSLTNFITVVNKMGNEIDGISVECPTESDIYDLCKYVNVEEVVISEAVYQMSSFKLEGGKTADLGYTIDIPSDANLTTFKTYDFVLMVTAEGVSQPFTVSVFYIPGGEEFAGFLTFFSNSTFGIPNWLITVGLIVSLIVVLLIIFGRHKKGKIKNFYKMMKG